MSPTFKWPTPPQFIFPPSMQNSASEACLAVFNDGRKQLGTLLQFLPDQEIIEFLPNRTDATIRLKPSEIQIIRLVRAHSFTKHFSNLENQGEEIYLPSETQTCTVEFSNGEHLNEQTAGFVMERSGLFLFLINDSGNVIRCFIPIAAIRNYQIGAPIGEMLVKENAISKKDVEAGLQKQKELRTQRIGDYLTANQIVSPEQLAVALKRQKSTPTLKLGEALIQEKLVTEEQLQEALQKQQKDRKLALGEILISMGLIDQDTVKRTLAKKMGIPVVNLHKFSIDPNVIKLVSASLVQKFTVMPLYRSENTLVVAVENPMHWEPLQELRFYTKLNVEPVMATRDDLLFAIDTFYGESQIRGNDSTTGTTKLDDLVSQLGESSNDLEDETVAESDNVLVRLVNKIILDAYAMGASDIHVENYPGKQATRIRFRKDGTLTSYLELPANYRSALVSRIKIMCQLDISEKRKPQDGKIDFQHFGPAKIELRVVTVPTNNGIEDVVMRVLAAAKPIPIEKLGLNNSNLNNLKAIAARPYGLFLICGPTGSGKTTTLHSVLGYINTPERKIWTAEDPIEITQPGLRQVQVNAKIGWTFAAAMRSFLRADPDVIMVGEMRDTDTTKTGIEASLTGHLVLSTLHTNSAPESIVRLLDLGMDPFNFADALLGVLAQRLAKRFCAECKKPYTASPEEIEALAAEYCLNTPFSAQETLAQWKTDYASAGQWRLYAKGGCEMCNQTGYRGRIGLHELLVASPVIKKLIQTHGLVSEIQAAAMAEGMRSLKQDGIEKILQGHTDITQIRAVCS